MYVRRISLFLVFWYFFGRFDVNNIGVIFTRLKQLARSDFDLTPVKSVNIASLSLDTGHHLEIKTEQKSTWKLEMCLSL